MVNGSEIRVDLGRKLQFTDSILSTTLWSDVVIWLTDGKKVISVELFSGADHTIENGCEEAVERKASKYEQLVNDCKDKGWQTLLFIVEMDWKIFPAQSVRMEEKQSKGWEKQLKQPPVGRRKEEEGDELVVRRRGAGSWPLLVTHELEYIVVKAQ